MKYKHFLLDWGNTLMQVNPTNTGAMYLWDEVFAVPNAKNLLTFLASKGQCHIASNAVDSDANDIRLALKRVKLDVFISHIFTAKSLGFSKTHAEYYPHIIQQLSKNRNELIMIGDNQEEDVIAATNAGIEAIWFNPLNKPAISSSLSFNSLNAIQDYLSTL